MTIVMMHAKAALAESSLDVLHCAAVTKKTPAKPIRRDSSGWQHFLDNRDYAPAYRTLPPNPIALDKPPINHPRGKDGGSGS
jgi:hypothetical protein